MADFRIDFPDTTVLIPVGLTVEVDTYSWDDRGGPLEAACSVTGPEEALWTAAYAWLGQRINVVNPLGTPVWWGVIEEIKVATDAFTVGLSLDNMANRVKVLWTQFTASGSVDTRETAWVDDLTSQARFGVIELTDSIGDGSTSLAAARSASILKAAAWPVGVPSQGGAAKGMTVRCAGLFQMLERKYYQNTAGRIENLSSSGNKTLSIGWQLVSSEVGFTNSVNELEHIGAKLHALRDGDKVVVTNSLYNNVVLDIDSTTDDAQRVATSSVVRFDEPDDIWDDNWYVQDYTTGWLKVTGSALNSAIWYVKDAQPPDRLTISPTYSGGPLYHEDAGPAITFTQGHRVKVTNLLTREKPSTNVITLTLYGYRIAQSFVPTVNMTLGQISLKLAKYGNPTDNLLVDFYSDSSLSPGSLLGTATLAGTDIFTGDSPSDYWITCPALTVTSGTRYWFQVRRSGSIQADNYYILGLSADTYDYCKVWTGSAWLTFNYREEVRSVPFRLWDTEDTSVGMTRIVTNCGQSFVTGVSVATTGVARCQYTNNAQTGLVEIKKLLDAGTSAGSRLVGAVGMDGKLIITAEPASIPEVAPILQRDGIVIDSFGSPWEIGRLPIATWLRYAGVPEDIGAAWRISPIFVQKASYDVQRRRLTVTPRLARTPFTFFRSG